VIVNAISKILLWTTVGIVMCSCAPERPVAVTNQLSDAEIQEQWEAAQQYVESELHDTAAQDGILLALYCGLVEEMPVPTQLGMFGDARNQELRNRLLVRIEQQLPQMLDKTRNERIELLWGADAAERYNFAVLDCGAAPAEVEPDATALDTRVTS